MFRKDGRRGRMETETKEKGKEKEGEDINERLQDKGDDGRRTGDGA